MPDYADQLLNALQQVLPARRPLPLHEPSLTELEAEAVADCVRSGFVSSVGAQVNAFESQLAEFMGSRHVVAVVNGTAGLQVALHAVGVRPGDEVILPALTFVGTANAASHVGATPHFVDSCEHTLGLDPHALSDYLRRVARSTGSEIVNSNTGARIAAIVPMHTFGHPMEIQQLLEVANEFGIPVVEDAAESLGSWSQGRHTGTTGRLGVVSFNGNKIITTGGGGAIVTDDEEMAESVRHLTTTAKVPHAWEYVHDAVGWNYRLPNLNAALGCAQLARLPHLIEAKRDLAHSYQTALNGSSNVEFVAEPNGTTSNYWLSTVRLINANAHDRDATLSQLHASGFLCRPAWNLLSALPMYQHCPRAPLPVAQDLERQLINLPSSPDLVERVA
jgi:perosamine synthetase